MGEARLVQEWLAKGGEDFAFARVNFKENAYHESKHIGHSG